MSNLELVQVTPQLAKEWLCKNDQNRNLRENVVNRYAEMMKSGEWTITHQGIAFDITGKLIDGQHRLAAIIKSEMTIPFMVCSDLPISSYPYIDGGFSRTMSDRIKLHPRHVDVLNFLFRIAFDYGRYPTPAQIVQLNTLLAPMNFLIDNMASRRKTPIICSAAVRSAAVYAALVGEPANEILEIYRNLADGEAKNLNGLAAELLRLILTRNISSREFTGSSGGQNLFFKSIPVFQRSGRQRKRFPPITDELISSVRMFLRKEFKGIS